MKRKWTRKGALAAFKRFHAKHGYQPVSDEAGSHNELPTYDTVVRLFGSWNTAIVACGWRPYPAQSSAQAKRMAYLDRNSNRMLEHSIRGAL